MFHNNYNQEEKLKNNKTKTPENQNSNNLENNQEKNLENVDNNQTITVQELTKTFNEQIKNEKEKYLSIIADYENKIKRTQIDAKNFISKSIEKLVIDLIPLIEDLTNAEKIASDEIKIGINLIIKNLKKILNNNGIIEIIPKEQEAFNLEIHQAISSDNVNFEQAKIKKNLKNGYKFKEKVILPAMVILEE